MNNLLIKLEAFAKAIKALNDSTDYSDITNSWNCIILILMHFEHSNYYHEIMLALQAIGVKTANVAAIIDAIGRFNHNPQ